MLKIKNLIDDVNAIDVVNEMISLHKDFYSDYNESRLNDTKSKYCEVIERLKTLRVNYKKGKEYTLIASYNFDGFEEYQNPSDIEWFIDSRLYKTSDLNNLRFNHRLYILNIDNLKDNREIKRYMTKYRKIIPESFAYEFDDWAVTLGYNVNKINIDEFGVLPLLASYLWEITFYGVDEEDVKEQRYKLAQIGDEVNEKMNIIKKMESEGKSVNLEDYGFHTVNLDDFEDEDNNTSNTFEINNNDNESIDIIGRNSLISYNDTYKDLVYYYIFRK